MAKNKVYIICRNCGGTGEVTRNVILELTGETTDETYVVTCPTCNGDGMIHWGYVDVE